MRLLFLIPLLGLPLLWRRQSAYVPIDSRFVDRYPWLVVSYYLDGTIKWVYNPFHPETVLKLEHRKPRGRADFARSYQLYEEGRVEQFGVWETNRSRRVDWGTWVQDWIAAIAHGTSAAWESLDVCEVFTKPSRSLYRPLA
jgi:hypothetical protein